MNQDSLGKETNITDEISIKDIMSKIRSIIKYLKSRFITILWVAFLFGGLGVIYSMYKKPVYTAVCSFVLEDGSKAGGMSQYAGLASLAGIDLGGSGGGGIFQGDNIIELYKSRIMIEKTLLSQVNIAGKKELLIDRYIDFNALRTNWKKNHIDNISFAGNPNNFTRTQDSIISIIVETFNKKVLTVNKLDKKLNIIIVQVASEDESFAKEFNVKLVQTVNEFYTTTKTKKSNLNVSILQRQADSVKSVLNNSINGVASAIDAAPNANPALLSLKVLSQKKQVDVQASTAIYAEIIKNLELSKISLRQDSPLIQVIDEPILPLSNDKIGKIKGMINGFFLGLFLSVFFLVIARSFVSGKN